MKRLSFILGLMLLFAAEILRIYFIMPFPGSQKKDTVEWAYFISRNIWWIRIMALLLLFSPVYAVFSKGKNWQRILIVILGIFYALVFFYFNFRFEADKMFRQTKALRFADAGHNGVDPDKLIIGVEINGVSKAFPIQFIGYHHQVRDSIAEIPFMVTYCTVCRTGRVYSPMVGGKADLFRLVGMDHFNAMFEDSRTGSWWQQATGMAVAGPLKGAVLSEWPSRQSTLGNWLKDHPSSLIMQPDTIYNTEYKELFDYDKGTINSSLEKRDSASWHRKSWVIGVKVGDKTCAYDWSGVLKKGLVQDDLYGFPLLVFIQPDSVSFHAFGRTLQGAPLYFSRQNDHLTDSNTHSLWNMNGKCYSGKFSGAQLETLPAYQEFWHSWKQFHPNTKVYKP